MKTAKISQRATRRLSTRNVVCFIYCQRRLALTVFTSSCVQRVCIDCSKGAKYNIFQRAKQSTISSKERKVVPRASKYLLELETGERKFTQEIVTDGNIFFRKPQREMHVAAEPNLKDFREVWGLDPGRREVFVASNTEGEVLRWSSKRYYHEAGFKRSGKKIKDWQDKEAFVLNTITIMPTKKSAHAVNLMECLRFVLPRLDQMLTFGMAGRMRDMKFGRYVGKQKTMNRMCQDLTRRAGRNTLIGFGDWSNKDSAGIIKKCPAGPVKAFERELKRRCRVISIDEFRSSKLHECCHQPMKNMYCSKQFVNKKTKTCKSIKSRRFMRCSSVEPEAVTANDNEPFIVCC